MATNHTENPLSSSPSDSSSTPVSSTTNNSKVSAAAEGITPKSNTNSNSNNNTAGVGGDKDEGIAVELPLQTTDVNSPELPEEKKTHKRFIENSGAIDKPTKKIAILPPGHDELPYELILVRHGESEGNLAQARSKRGDMSAYTPEFRKKHSSSYRLTDKGIMQAKLAGQWLREHTEGKFDRYYTSEYVRAMETAALLDLPDAKWYTEIVLRERDKGHLDNVSWSEKNERFSHEMELRKRDSFFWAPPGGESIAQICVRVDHTFNTMRRECSRQKVIIACHGEVMWAFRVRVERLNSVRFHKLQSSKDKRDLIHNGTILHYTRVHPTTGEIYPTFRFMRTVCPWKPEYNSEGWMEFERPVYDNDELLASVKTVPRLVNNEHNSDDE